ncbi:MAG: 4Fe-4S ferredoxin [Bacteroidota bacterium]|nr:4Fe-4S ferredoxin [Bacteroidota bacterium]
MRIFVTVVETMVDKGANTVIAHMKHLKDHNENELLEEATRYLENNADVIEFDIRKMISEANIRSLHILVMEVPCCGGLSRMVQITRSQARRDIPVEVTVVSIHGEVLKSINI